LVTLAFFKLKFIFELSYINITRGFHFDNSMHDYRAHCKIAPQNPYLPSPFFKQYLSGFLFYYICISLSKYIYIYIYIYTHIYDILWCKYDIYISFIYIYIWCTMFLFTPRYPFYSFSLHFPLPKWSTPSHSPPFLHLYPIITIMIMLAINSTNKWKRIIWAFQLYLSHSIECSPVVIIFLQMT
jgi:hypothetical protein